MTLGDGIFASTILIVVAFAFWKITIHHKWLLTLKIIVGSISALYGTIVLYEEWEKYKRRPQEVFSHNNIELDMSEAEVIAQLGEAKEFSNKENEKIRNAQWRKSGGEIMNVGFDVETKTVIYICEKSTSLSTPAGYSPRQWQIERKLGEPSSVAYFANNTIKVMYYKKFNTSYHLEKGEVITYCVSEGARY